MELNCSLLESVTGSWIIHVFISAFLSILFMQSGLDKTFDFKGNLSWLKGHFADSLLGGMVPAMLGIITAVELAAGMLCGIGALEALVYGTFYFGYAGSIAAAVALLMLFFGQRVAKDYAGAATLVPYFILVMLHLALFSIAAP